MYEWFWQDGRLVALDEAGVEVAEVLADAMWAPLADLWNANPRLSEVLVQGLRQRI